MTRVDLSPNVTLYRGDCLEVMPTLGAGSIDMVLTDPPYGTTACKWDSVIPFEPMWAGVKHVAKKNAAIVMTASQPFTSALVMSNVKMFKYEWVWSKTNGSNFATLKYTPWRMHENVLVFGRTGTTYNPQKYRVSDDKVDKRKTINNHLSNKKGVIGTFARTRRRDDGTRYPSSIQAFANPNHKSLHPTQKPVYLMEYLIRTYTNEGQTVLDFTLGSGTTGVAAVNLGRRFVGIEMDEKYFEVSATRIQSILETLDGRLL